MNKYTQIITAWELLGQDITKTSIAKHVGVHRNTIHKLIHGIEENGLQEYLSLYEKAKKHTKPWQNTPLPIKKLIWKIRHEERDCCGQKIQYYLRKEHGIKVSVATIYDILKDKYIIKSKWKKNIKRGKVPTATQPRQVVQMDTIDFGDIFAFTSVDIFTREVDVRLAPSLEAKEGRHFLIQCMRRRFDRHVNIIQTDGGSEFKREFAQTAPVYCDRHRVSRPYKKNEQSYIESFNRTFRKECLGWGNFSVDDLDSCTKETEQFLYNYHYRRPHMGLNMKTPIKP